MASARALGMVTMNWSFGSCCTLTRRGIGHIEYDSGFNIYVSVVGGGESEDITLFKKPRNIGNLKEWWDLLILILLNCRFRPILLYQIGQNTGSGD